jgi:hypothetical protein
MQNRYKVAPAAGPKRVERGPVELTGPGRHP